MQIKEFLANPAGSDKSGEYILLFNDASEAVNVKGWSVKDASGKKFSLSGTIAPQAELKLPSTLTKISINNNGETISLFDKAGKQVDILSYSGSAIEDVPTTRNNELTAQVREQLFDDLPGKYLPTAHLTVGSNVWLIVIASALILAGLSVYILSHVSENPYDLNSK